MTGKEFLLELLEDIGPLGGIRLWLKVILKAISWIFEKIKECLQKAIISSIDEFFDIARDSFDLRR